MFAWILKTKAEKAGSSGATCPSRVSLSSGGGASSRYFSRKVK